MKQHITVELQGVRLQVRTDHEPFLTRLISYLEHSPYVTEDREDCHIGISLQYLVGTEEDHQRYTFEGSEGLDSIGYRISLNGQRVDWSRIPEPYGLKMSFQRADGQYSIKAVFHELRDSRYYLHLAKSVLRRQAIQEQRRDIVEQLIEWLIYYPICWYLLEHRGMHLMHASGLEINGKGILFPGMPGAGKSTVSAYLFSAFRGQFLSDNLVFYDEQKVYSCVEPILLTPFSRSLLDPADTRLRFTDTDAEYGRKVMLVDPKALVSETRPRIICLLRLSKGTYRKPVTTSEAVSRIMDCNELAGEVKRFYGYTSVMNSLLTERVLARERVDALYKLLQGVDCYEVGMKQGLDPKSEIEKTITPLL